MLEGRFAESDTDRHVARRAELLAGDGGIPPLGPVKQWPVGTRPERVLPSISDELADNGLAVADFDGPLPPDDFIGLGEQLGSVMQERDPTVQPRVYRGGLLNLVTEIGHTADVAVQPFSTTGLAMHTEASGKPVAEQPRYIALMCLEPGDQDSSAQTVVVAMADIAARLSRDDLAVLEELRYHRNTAGPFIARQEEGRTVLSFRDFCGDELHWVHEGRSRSATEINDVLRRLLAAIYHPGSARVARWRRGRLVVLDNTRFMHGRTAGARETGAIRRHLQRLRIN